MFMDFINLQRKRSPPYSSLNLRGAANSLMCKLSHAAGPSRTLVLSLAFCMHVSLGTKPVGLLCVAVEDKLCLCVLVWMTLAVFTETLCISLICGCGGKISFGI